MFRQARLQTKIFKLRKQLTVSVIESEHYNKMQNELLQNNEEFGRLAHHNKSRSEPLSRNAFDSSSITIGNVQKTF